MTTEFPSIERAIYDALGHHPTPKHRRAVAQTLHDLAKKQEEIADAEDRQARKAPADRLRRVPGGRRGRQPGAFVRIERSERDLVIYVGRGLYYQLGSPARLDVQRQAGKLLLVTVEGQDGYSVIAGPNLMPKIRATGARDLIDQEDGRYQAQVSGHTLTIGERRDGE